MTSSPARARVLELTAANRPDPSPVELDEIARNSFSFEDFTEIMRALWTRLNGDGRTHRSIEKALEILLYILVHGSEQVASEARVHVAEVKTLTDFRYVVSGVDVGSMIRDRAHSIMRLLNDESTLQEARAGAKRR